MATGAAGGHCSGFALCGNAHEETALSTKNLARTVIEGGRAHGNTWDRRQSNADLRAAMRTYNRMVLDPDAAWSTVPPRRRKIYRDFHDRLGPVYRWLDRRCGRPWTEVRAETSAASTRARWRVATSSTTTCCARCSSAASPPPTLGTAIGLNEHGVLRAMRRHRWHRPRFWLTAQEQADLRTFAADRKVRALGATYFWLEMTYVYRLTKGLGPEPQPTGRYRQTRRLTSAEVNAFVGLSQTARKTLLVRFPGR